MDTIVLRNFHMTAIIGPDAWNRSRKPQPLILTVKLLLDTRIAGTSDEIAHTFSYGQMCKDLSKVSNGQFHNIDELIDDLAGIALDKGWPGESLQISLNAPKALLRVEGGLTREVTLVKQTIEDGPEIQQTWSLKRQAWLVRQLNVACIIGVNPHERLEKQQVAINLQILGNPGNEEGDSPWRTLVSRVCSVVEPSEFYTLEALAALIAKTCLVHLPIPQITVLVEKPSALTFVEGAGVEITRSRDFLAQ